MQDYICDCLKSLSLWATGLISDLALETECLCVVSTKTPLIYLCVH